ncbi:MAG: LamG domain-containing protein [Bacteroidia bacterium]|nr:LamG domain-containing protein [Bacteroidia bacterium]
MMWDKGGKKGGAMEFDGTNDGIVFGDILDMGMNNFSISAWVKSTSTETGNASNANGIVYKKPAGQRYLKGYRLNMPNGQFKFTIADGTNYKEFFAGKSGQYNNNEWHHVVAIAKRGSVMKVYIDGKLINSVIETNVGNIDSDVDFAIGILNADYPYYHPFDGLIDEVKIYNYALSEDEIKTLYNDSSAMVMGNDESRDNNGTEVTGANKDYCIPGDTAKCDKPVLELNLDERSGATAKDSSGNGRDGTISGAVWDRGKINSGLKFDGDGDRISVDNGSDLATSTYCAWHYYAGEDMYGLVEGADTDANFDAYISGLDDVYFWADNTDGNRTMLTGGKIVENQWNQVCFVFGTGKREIYINGAKTAGDTSTAKPIRYNFIGETNSLSYFGSIDEVRIYDYARTPAQIAWDYNRGKPISHWTFDEGNGTTAHDLGEGENHGTITGATWKNESECKNGKCLYFDGLDLTRVDMDTQDNMSQFTACASINVDDFENLDGENVLYILSKGFTMSLKNEGKIGFSRAASNGYSNAETQDLISAGQWYRVCGVLSSINMAPKIYLNGIEQILSVAQSSGGVMSDDSSSVLRIGASAGSSYAYNFYGYIDDPKIYNYALTDEQIKMDYNDGAVNFR